jgi:hypothetical protein
MTVGPAQPKKTARNIRNKGKPADKRFEREPVRAMVTTPITTEKSRENQCRVRKGLTLVLSFKKILTLTTIAAF